MSAVTPPPPPPPPVVQTVSQPTAIVSNPPATLTSAALGTRIDAIIVATAPDGRVEVESRLGRFFLLPNVTLPKEGAIQLQIQVLARQLFLAITSIHGKPPIVALRKLGLGLQSSRLSITNPMQSSPQGGIFPTSLSAINSNSVKAGPIAIGSTLTATILKPAALMTKSANSPNSAFIGTSKTTPTGSKTSVFGAKAAAAYGSIINDPTSISSSSFIISRRALTVKVLAFKIPPSGRPQPLPSGISMSSAWPSNPKFVKSQKLDGFVISNFSPNLLILQTKFGPISLNIPSTLPFGTSVQLEILAKLPNPQLNPQDPLAVSRMSDFLLQNRTWPVLEEAIDTLRDSNSQLALNFINTSLPKPNGAFAANIMRFILGIRSGELSNFMADASLRLLMQNKPDLAKRLRDDFRILGRMSEEPVSGDWRALPIPIANGHEIEQIRLLMRRVHANEVDEENRTGPGIRFVVEVDLTRMGRLQLDGLVHETTKHFDLVIRSNTPIAHAMQNDIREIFENAQELTGTKGWLRFQAAPAKFVKVFGNNPNHQIGLIV